MSVQFNSWEDLFLSVLKDEPSMFYVIKHPTSEDRSRFMDKGETLQYIKMKIVESKKSQTSV